MLKVFAQGPMAKDLRKFVQSFNMSRKFADDQTQNQNQPFDYPTSEYDINFEDDDVGGDMENPEKKRRTDWTEYLDPEDPKLVSQEKEQDGYLEPEIVTELPPKEKFKRPKLSNYETGESTGDHRHYYKPVFSKRNTSIKDDTMLISQDEKAMGNVRNLEESISDCQAVTAKLGNYSKWKHYISEDDEGESFRLCCPTNSAHHVNKWGDAVFKTETNYQNVEDDIHPDFI
ncbi:hypothetical protein PTKIN_Ptkin18bG0086300 [Pterospermum kingtungense]